MAAKSKRKAGGAAKAKRTTKMAKTPVRKGATAGNSIKLSGKLYNALKAKAKEQNVTFKTFVTEPLEKIAGI